ncbi:UNVERIFIED_CONTAM: hypothetical protein FKN15_027139 [Acipenser sinensis]
MPGCSKVFNDTELSPYTVYSYYIVASNVHGLTRSATVSYRTMAGIPIGDLYLNLIGSAGSQTASFNWTSSLNTSGPIEKYVLSSITLGDPEARVHYQGHQTSVTITELAPFTRYNFSLKACTSGGCAEGRSITVVTAQIPPEGQAPPRIKNISSTELYVEWDPPVEPNGIIIRYELYMQGPIELGQNHILSERRVFYDSGWFNPQPVLSSANENALMPPQTNTTVRDLEPFSMYQFRVYAVNMAGSTHSEWVSGKTGEAAPVCMPPPTIYPLNSSSLNVTWLKPSDNATRGLVTEYRINIHEEQTSNQFAPPVVSKVLHKASPHEQAYKVTGLKPYRTYNFTITLCNQLGCITSLPASGQTLAAAPARIRAPKLEGLNMTVIKISWDPPKEVNGPPPLYQLERMDTSLTSSLSPVMRGTRFPGHGYYRFQNSTLPVNTYFTGIKLSFRTREHEGLILFAVSAGSQEEYIALQIHNGRPYFLFDPQASAVAVSPLNDGGKLYNDNQWHHVIAKRNQAVGTIIVDNQYRGTVSATSGSTIIGENTGVFLGGLPKGFLLLRDDIGDAKLVERGFLGCISDVYVKKSDTPSEVWELLDWEQAEEKAGIYHNREGCPKKLMEGAHFLGQGDAKLVERGFLGCISDVYVKKSDTPSEVWELLDWEQAEEKAGIYHNWEGCPKKLMEGAHFLGQGFLELHSFVFSGGTEFEISFEFRTDQLNGLLLFAFNKEELVYLAAELRSGTLSFMFKTSQDFTRVDLWLGLSYCEGSWNRVTLRKQGSVATASMNKLTEQVSGTVAEKLNINSPIYLGGIPAEMQSSFRGLGLQQGFLELHSFVFSGGTEFEISFEFRTDQLNGLLLFAFNKEELVYLAAELRSGTLSFMFKTSQDFTRVDLWLGLSYCEGSWNRVTLRKQGSVTTASMNKLTEQVSGTVAEKLNINSPIYLGGIPAEMQSSFRGLGLQQGFGGCIKDVKFTQGAVVNLAAVSSNAVRVNLDGCLSTDTTVNCRGNDSILVYAGEDRSVQDHHLQTFSEYLYRVVASNDGGSTSSPWERGRTREAVPQSVPTPSRVHSVNGYSVEVSWDEPAGVRGVIEKYVLKAYNEDSPSMPPITAEFTSTHTLTGNLTGLVPFTNYSITLTACTLAGCTESLNAWNISTPQEAPSDVEPPAADAHPYSLSLFWHVPHQPNGVVTEYALHSDNMLIYKGNQTQYNITGLGVYTPHWFVLTACTIIGCTNSSQVTLFTAQLPPTHVDSPIPTVLDSRSIYVHWGIPGSGNAGSSSIGGCGSGPDDSGNAGSCNTYSRKADSSSIGGPGSGNANSGVAYSARGDNKSPGPKGVAIAVVAQYGIMPLTAFTLAKVFQLGSIESVTVLICGCCPGGNLSNIFALALKGDMNLRWRAPTKINGVLERYLLYISTMEHEFGDSNIVYNSSELFHDYTVRHLTPGTSYFMRLAACSGGGCTVSEPIMARTEESTPENVPAPNAQSFLSDSFNVSWTEPEHPNGIITSYGLYMNGVLVQNSTNLHFHISGLAPWSLHTFRVQACTAKGCALGLLVEARTLEAAPVGTVALEMSVEGPRSVRAKWTTPAKPNGLLKYSVLFTGLFYADQGIITSYGLYMNGVLVQNSTNLHFHISGLAPWSLHTFRVQACTAKGCALGLLVEARTLEAAPVGTVALEMSVEGPRSVRAKWTTPAKPNGLLKYSVLFTGLFYADQALGPKPPAEGECVLVPLPPAEEQCLLSPSTPAEEQGLLSQCPPAEEACLLVHLLLLSQEPEGEELQAQPPEFFWGGEGQDAGVPQQPLFMLLKAARRTPAQPPQQREPAPPQPPSEWPASAPSPLPPPQSPAREAEPHQSPAREAEQHQSPAKGGDYTLLPPPSPGDYTLLPPSPAGAEQQELPLPPPPPPAEGEYLLVPPSLLWEDCLPLPPPPAEGEYLLVPPSLLWEDCLPLPPPPAEGEYLLVPPSLLWEDCLPLPPPPAEGEYLLVPPSLLWEDCLPLPPPPAEGEYLLVPPSLLWEDCLPLPPPPAEGEYLLVPPSLLWEDCLPLPPPPAEGEYLLVPPSLLWEDCLPLPPPPAEGEYLLVPPSLLWEDCLPLPPPPAEGEYLLVPPSPLWEDCWPLPPPPAEGEYLLVPPSPLWEDCWPLPPPPAEGEYLLVPPSLLWEDCLPLPPPPAEGEYLLVPPSLLWEDCLPLPPPPAEDEYLLVPPPPGAEEQELPLLPVPPPQGVRWPEPQKGELPAA